MFFFSRNCSLRDDIYIFFHFWDCVDINLRFQYSWVTASVSAERILWACTVLPCPLSALESWACTMGLHWFYVSLVSHGHPWMTLVTSATIMDISEMILVRFTDRTSSEDILFWACQKTTVSVLTSSSLGNAIHLNVTVTKQLCCARAMLIVSVEVDDMHFAFSFHWQARLIWVALETQGILIPPVFWHVWHQSHTYQTLGIGHTDASLPKFDVTD